MTLPMTLNRLLAKFDIALTRRTTLDRTRAQLADSLEQARRLSAELARLSGRRCWPIGDRIEQFEVDRRFTR